MKQSSKYSDFIEFLNDGKICVFETDTVVGIGCKIFNDGIINSKVQEIFNIKKRKNTKTFPWLISSEKMLNEYTIKINKIGQNLINEKWPGATTLIFKVKNRVDDNLCVIKNNAKSIGFRIPNNEELINAIDFIGCPIIGTSANLSGKNPVSNIDKVDKNILEAADFVYTKKLHRGDNYKPSTIILCLEETPKVLR